MLHLSPAKILGKVLNFILPPYPKIIRIWLTKISFSYIILQILQRKNLGVGRFRPPPPPLVPEGLIHVKHFKNSLY